MTDVIAPVLARLLRGEELTADEIDGALGHILDGQANDVEIAGFIVALRTKGETADELAALVRKALGVPTTFNFLGPLANPARVTRQCVGVSDPAMAERVLRVLVANGAEHAFVFCGDDGLDELTLTTTSRVHEYVDGVFRSH